jgi:TolA-binding protein
VASPRDQAAQILIDRANRLLQRNGDIEQATAAYQRVIELFPTTPAAQAARKHLNSLKA